MHGLVIKLKNGKTKCGFIWEWRPHLGTFSYTDDETGECVPMNLADCESLVLKSSRGTASDAGEDEDLLERARAQGWSG